MLERGVLEAHRAEILAVKRGLSARDPGLDSMILEGDVQAVFESSKSSSMDLSYNGILLNEILMAYGFNRFKAQFLPKQYNGVGDCLAHITKIQGSKELGKAREAIAR